MTPERIHTCRGGPPRGGFECRICKVVNMSRHIDSNIARVLGLWLGSVTSPLLIETHTHSQTISLKKVSETCAGTLLDQKTGELLIFSVYSNNV